MMENEAKRAKVRIIIAFSVLIAALLIIAAALNKQLFLKHRREL